MLLVVLALDDDVGAWCGERIVLGPGDSVVSPTVLGAATVVMRWMPFLSSLPPV